MLIGVTVLLWTAKNVTSWHLPFWGSDTLRNSRNSRETTTVTLTMEECSDLPAKKRKLGLPSRETNSTSQPSRLDIVPVEILAEILYYVTSPKDVLSVARCNKRLCATLLNPSNVMIWRRARSHCIVPGLPPPPPGWSESAYAAFIFDPGNCHVCRVHSYPLFMPILD